MTLRFLDGIDNYPAGTTFADFNVRWSGDGGVTSAVPSGWSLGTGLGRYGGAQFQRPGTAVGSGTSAGNPVVIPGTFNTTAGVENYIGFWHRNNQGNSSPMAIVLAGGFTLLSAGILRGAQFSQLGAGSPQIGYSGFDLCDGELHWIELRIKAAQDTTGRITCYIDGELEFDVQNVQTVVTGTTLNNQWSLQPGSIFALSGTVAAAYDDVVIWDNQGTDFNTFPIGPQRAIALNVAGAGAQQNWVPSASTNVAIVQQRYNNATPYIQDVAGVNTTDFYTVNGLPYTPDAISAVQVNYKAAAPDVTRSFLPTFAPGTGGGAQVGPLVVLPVGATGVVYNVRYIQKVSGGAWTPADLTGLQIGQTSVSI